MTDTLTKKTPVTIGLMISIIAFLYGGSLYVDSEIEGCADTLRSERDLQYGELKEDVGDLKTQVHEIQTKQTSDNEKILLLLLDIKNGGS